MMILAITGAAVLFSYLVVMAVLYGVDEYISDNYYMGRHRWMFSAVMCASSILTLPAMMAMEGKAPALALFANAGLLVVAISPYYKIEKMHATGAVASLIFGAAWVATFHPLMVGVATMLWAAYYLLKLPKPYYAGEVATFLLIYANIFWDKL